MMSNIWKIRLKTNEVVSDGEKVYPTDFQFRAGNRIYFDINL